METNDAFLSRQLVFFFHFLSRATHLFAKMQQLLLRCGHPKRVLCDDLPVRENELRHGQAACAPAQLLGKAKAVRDWQRSDDLIGGEEDNVSMVLTTANTETNGRGLTAGAPESFLCPRAFRRR